MPVQRSFFFRATRHLVKQKGRSGFHGTPKYTKRARGSVALPEEGPLLGAPARAGRKAMPHRGRPSKGYPLKKFRLSPRRMIGTKANGSTGGFKLPDFRSLEDFGSLWKFLQAPGPSKGNLKGGRVGCRTSRIGDSHPRRRVHA
jgi:hypothetical protein